MVVEEEDCLVRLEGVLDPSPLVAWGRVVQFLGNLDGQYREEESVVVATSAEKVEH